MEEQTRREKIPVIASTEIFDVKSLSIKLEEEGIATEIDKFLGTYIIYVNESNYRRALLYAKKHANREKVSMINRNNEFRDLDSMSILYCVLKDKKNLDSMWEYKDSQPEEIKKLIDTFQDLIGWRVYINVNLADGAIEVLAKVRDNDEFNEKNNKKIQKKFKKAIKKICPNLFLDVIPCTIDGIVKYSEKKKKIIPIQNIFDNSLFMDGLRYPNGANIVSKVGNEEVYEEGGYFPSSERYGGQYFRTNVQALDDKYYEIKGSAELYEFKEYNYYIKDDETYPIDRFKTKLVDNIEFTSTISVLSDIEVEMVTCVDIKRNTTYSPSNEPEDFNNRKSIRNGLFNVSLKDGDYKTEITENFVIIAGGTRLLHVSSSSPYFEIFEIPEDFDFEYNNEALKEYPKVFDDVEFDTLDPSLDEVKKYLPDSALGLYESYMGVEHTKKLN